MVRAVDDRRDRAQSNPLFGDNRLKLGTFNINASNGAGHFTTLPERHQIDWPRDMMLNRTADEMGFEALVSAARWRGFGGKVNLNGTSFEPFTWAAGVAAGTEHAAVMTTTHVPTLHPLLAAKQGATIDHISAGRFGLNIVCGWVKPEMEMFGGSMMDQEKRYRYAGEWVEILRLAWEREDYFDYDGQFLQVRQGFLSPKPVQQPFPALMNAGSSEIGRHFVARYCDLGFVVLDPDDLEAIAPKVAAYKRLAREEYGREIQVWTYAYIVQRDTQVEAEDYLQHYAVRNGDEEGARIALRERGLDLDSWPQDVRDRALFNAKAGLGAFPLVGTAQRIAERLEYLSRAGLDGVIFSWVDFADGLARFDREVMPLLDQAGLHRGRRSSFMTAAGRPAAAGAGEIAVAS